MTGPGGSDGSTRTPGFTAESSIHPSSRPYPSPHHHGTTTTRPQADRRGLTAAQQLVDYDRRWPRVFEAERRRIRSAVGARAVAIEHVGSSSVPGLQGRSEIDILLGVASAADVGDCAAALERIGYSTSSRAPSEGWWLLSKPGTCPVEVLVVVHRGPLWLRHLGFRDYLRGDPAKASTYGRLKSEWAARYGAGTRGYKEAKRRFWIAVGETMTARAG
jgi:GrpB-like predicted nucleotidyltransferase (UPF0157 family)